MKRNDSARFVRVWQRARSAAEAAKALGITQGSARTMASRLRGLGVRLKRFGRLCVADLNREARRAR